jgi:hypothetical protein
VRRGAKGRIYRASVAYQYRVHNELFTGKRIFFGDELATSFENYAVDRVARYPVGVTIAVVYNPLHPEQCVLERIPWPSIVFGAFGLVGLLVFAWVFPGV